MPGVSLTYADLSEADVQQLRGMRPAEAKDFIQRRFFAESSDARNVILIDMLYHALCFAFDEALSDEKVSTVFSIMKRTHELTVANQHSLEESFAAFRRLVLQHSVHRPPFSVEIFTFPDVELITSYALGSYFKHYKLYAFTFLNKVELDLLNIPNDFVELPAAPPPLAQALTEEQHRAKVQAEEAQRSEEAQRAAAAAEAARLAAEEEATRAKMGQMELLKDDFRKMAAERLHTLESRVAELEGQLGAGGKKK